MMGTVVSMSRMIHSGIGMESLQQTAARVIAPLLQSQPHSPGKMAFAWSIAAGPVLGRHGRAVWHGDGILRIVADEPAWHTELVRARPVITQRLTQLLGPDAITRIEFIRP